MKTLKKNTINKLKKIKNKLEKKLKVKLKIKGNKIEIFGETQDIYIAGRVLNALDRNFQPKIALLLIRDDYHLEDIPIKNCTNRKDLTPVKSRIIGKNAKTIKTLNRISRCHITLHNNTVSILGPAEDMKDTITAIKNLIQGSKHGNVYSYLERVNTKDKQDLGLKEGIKG
jgi:KH domain-containing protein